MKKSHLNRHSLEILEARIAPATVPLTAQWLQATHSADGSPIELRAGQGLSTGGPNSGDYLLYLAKGNALIFTTDFNNNNLVDFNEITGIAAGEGMRLISFVDIHGDIATNLRETATSLGSQAVLSLSDSNNNPSDDVNHPTLRGDGRAILNNRIEGIELRTLTVADISDQNDDGVVDDTDVDLRRAPSTHSIFGNIYAGRGFGVPGDATSGLLIDSTILTNFGFENEVKPMIGSIFVGTAVSGEYFSFGVKGQFETSGGVMTQRVRAGVVIGDDVQGYIVPFVPSPGQEGASIAFVRSKNAGQLFNLSGLYAGDGGANAAGGSIMDVTISGDDAGGYDIIAGNGGDGTRGGAGGSIIRFSDLASDTSEVIIQSGSGGSGSAGAGGNAGSSEILSMNVYGAYSIILGDGGNGFTQGGSGASLARAVITEVSSVGETAGTVWATSHSPYNYIADPSNPRAFIASLGTQQSFDIDGDGVSDLVFTTNDVSQLVVLFGDGTRMSLDSPRNPEAMTVADLDGDGRPDIAAASSDLGNQSGIIVYLAKWEDVNADGDVLDIEDRFVGFHSPRFSTLPQLETGDSTTGNADLGYWQSPNQVAELVAGDFDGDGANELAAIVTYFSSPDEPAKINGVTVGYSANAERQVLVFLSPDRELDTNTDKYFFTGQFYADFGTKRVTTQNADAPAEPWVPFIDLGGGFAGQFYAQSTALTLSSDHDVVITGELGTDGTLKTNEYFIRGASAPRVTGGWDLNQVDTDRRAGPNFVAPADVRLLDFALMDFDGDDAVDMVVVAGTPANFLVGIKGDGTGRGTQDSGRGTDQSGFLMTGVTLRGVKAYGGSEFAVLYQAGPSGVIGTFDYSAGPQTGNSGMRAGGPLVAKLGNVTGYHGGSATDQVMWDIYEDSAVIGPDAGGRILFGALTALWNEQQFNIFAGDGGDSFIGKGGNGGFIGGKGKFETIVDPLTGIGFTDFAGAVRIEFEGFVTLMAGEGGLGFSRGGNGGTISGVSVRDGIRGNNIGVAAEVFAGDGGRGISGTGGIGGDLVANSIFAGNLFVAGNGGDGKFGGRGGSVIGNGLSLGTTRLYDTVTASFEAFAGNGGDGIKAGGAGGSVVNVRPVINGTSGLPGFAGSLHYVAGNGGNAAAGSGGAGGSITNSSPELNAVLEDQVSLEAGNGGNGRNGGAGGSITQFSITQSIAAATNIVHFVAGHGGDGTTGTGGRGGNLSAINANSNGSSATVIFPTPIEQNLFEFSRFLAGDGGISSGGRGGDGGTISNIVTGASQGSIAFAGGAGGAGLTQGGLGGSILNVTLSGLGAGTNSKGLIIAGAGGDARAFLPNPLDTTPDQGKKAFGGRVGSGGNGGSINGFRQFGDNKAHMDFIAGNGGSTVNYGTTVDPKPFVGRGGSIMNVDLSGTAGNIDPASPIHAYNDVFNGETVQDYVESHLRVGIGFGQLQTLGDGDGNVGIVVGAAGRNKAVRLDPLGQPYDYIDQPATNAKNGDLINFEAQSIMSAVAGSVDRLAAIQLAKSIRVDPGTKVGQDKNPIGSFDYLDENGVPVDHPVRDGQLVDGAIIAKFYQQSPLPDLDGRRFSF